jgi:hypothetical protein
MSEENVETVRRYYEEWPEASELPEWVAGFWESNGDYYPVRGFPEARPCHGREEIAAFLASCVSLGITESRSRTRGRLAMIASSFMHGCGQRGARAVRPWKATSTSAAGSGMDDSSGLRIT